MSDYICPPDSGKLIPADETIDARTCHEKHSAADAQRQRDIEELWTIVTQLQLNMAFVKQLRQEVAEMKRLLREWQGD